MSEIFKKQGNRYSPAELLYQRTQEARIKNIEGAHEAFLNSLEVKIIEAVSDGDSEVTGVFIDHKMKGTIKWYLEEKGFTVRELKMGNTFTISWAQ
ncbi:hypothetical protein [Edaphovirga cremea]|uniref:hypothetical protein n=1 Tax=Edaphovirga cremea TaxID=2267246 RepID=UPI00398A36D1